MLVFSVDLPGQSYTLNYKDPSTYTITCGSVNPAQWEVKNDSCLLYTPVFYPDAGVSDSIWVFFTIRINQSGNLNPDDNAYIHNKLNSGSFVQKQKYDGNSVSCVFTYTDSMKVSKYDSFQFRIALQNNSKTNFWQIKDGDIQVSNVRYGGTLPVEFLDVEAIQKEQAVMINWTTASETNNDYFTIERSEDGKAFSPVAFVKGAGNSNQVSAYSAEDYSPAEGINIYRIKQTDFDGKFAYSDNISVTYSSKTETMTIFPNPAKAGETLQLVSSSESLKTISMFTFDGEKILETSGTGSQNIPLSSLDKGVYFVIVTNGEANYSQKLIIN